MLDPDPSSIEIFSIASALSKICRFGGHCPSFYSVAEHSVHAALLSERYGYGREITKAVFLHDATEAYLGDMVKPLKNSMTAYRLVEKNFERALSERFDIDFEGNHSIIKKIDREVIKAEKRALWPNDTHRWTGLLEVEEVEIPFHFYPPELAFSYFFNFAKYLDVK